MGILHVNKLPIAKGLFYNLFFQIKHIFDDRNRLVL